jgi:hypothetical protein
VHINLTGPDVPEHEGSARDTRDANPHAAAALRALWGGLAPARCGPPTTAAPAFTARVTPAGARFVLPARQTSTWEWNRPTTPDDHAEYMWRIALDNGGRAYEFGFYRFKFAGARPARGSLGDLLFAGQQTVAARSGSQGVRPVRGPRLRSRRAWPIGGQRWRIRRRSSCCLGPSATRRVQIEVSGEKGVTREVQFEYDP